VALGRRGLWWSRGRGGRLGGGKKKSRGNYWGARVVAGRAREEFNTGALRTHRSIEKKSEEAERGEGC